MKLLRCWFYHGSRQNIYLCWISIRKLFEYTKFPSDKLTCDGMSGSNLKAVDIGPKHRFFPFQLHGAFSFLNSVNWMTYFIVALNKNSSWICLDLVSTHIGTIGLGPFPLSKSRQIYRFHVVLSLRQKIFLPTWYACFLNSQSPNKFCQCRVIL